MKTKDITLTGLMAALIFIGTFFFKIPSPFGYNHFGDGFMLLTVFMLGYKKGAFAGAIGAGLADLRRLYCVGTSYDCHKEYVGAYYWFIYGEAWKE